MAITAFLIKQLQCNANNNISVDISPIASMNRTGASLFDLSQVCSQIGCSTFEGAAMEAVLLSAPEIMYFFSGGSFKEIEESP